MSKVMSGIGKPMPELFCLNDRDCLLCFCCVNNGNVGCFVVCVCQQGWGQEAPANEEKSYNDDKADEAPKTEQEKCEFSGGTWNSEGRGSCTLKRLESNQTTDELFESAKSDKELPAPAQRSKKEQKQIAKDLDNAIKDAAKREKQEQKERDKLAKAAADEERKKTKKECLDAGHTWSYITDKCIK